MIFRQAEQLWYLGTQVFVGLLAQSGDDIVHILFIHGGLVLDPFVVAIQRLSLKISSRWGGQMAKLGARQLEARISHPCSIQRAPQNECA